MNEKMVGELLASLPGAPVVRVVNGSKLWYKAGIRP